MIALIELLVGAVLVWFVGTGADQIGALLQGGTDYRKLSKHLTSTLQMHDYTQQGHPTTPLPPLVDQPTQHLGGTDGEGT